MSSDSRSLSSQLKRALFGFGAGLTILVAITVSTGSYLVFAVEPDMKSAVNATRYLRDAHQGMLDQETGLRGYLLTGDTGFLDPYESGRRAVSDSMVKFDKYLQSHPKLVQQTLTLQTGQRRWQEQWAEPTLVKRQSGNYTASDLEAGRQLFDSYRSAHTTLFSTIENQRDALMNRQRALIGAAFVLQAFISIIVVSSLAGVLRRIGQSLRAPVTSALETMRRVAAGDYDARPELVGPSEMYQLNTGLSTLVGSLQESAAAQEDRTRIEAARNARLTELLELTRYIGAATDVAQAARAVAAAAQRIVSAQEVAVWLVAADNQTVKKVASHSDKPVIQWEPGDDATPSTLVIAANKLAAPAGTKPAFGGGVSVEGGNAAFPMVVAGHVTGVIECLGVDQELDLATHGLIETLAAHAGSAIERALLGQQMELILQSSGDAIFGLDNAGRLTFANDSACELVGYRSEDLIGRNLHELLHHHRADGEPYPEDDCPATKTLADGVSRRVYDEVLWSRSGSAIPVEWSVKAVRYEGATDGVVINAVDVSERRKAEAALALARDRAEEASRLKSEFLANMSHEIRTPLNGVIGMTGLLLDTDLDDQQREFARTARRSGETLLDIINDILDLSKIEAGKLDLEFVDFDLRTVVEEVGDLFATRAYEKNVELAVLVDPEVPERVNGDPGRLRQIFTNLTGNAVKFTEAGEVVIRVGVESDDGESVILKCEVSDTGIGLLPEQAENLFQKFSQADASTTRRYGGTGLGLAICKQLTELMEGSIGVDSDYGAGSTFWFKVKLAKRPALQQPLNTDSGRIRALKVLVVDDNATNRRILECELGIWGIKPGLAPGADRALDLLRKKAAAGEGFDVAILDGHMPGMDGYQLAEAIAADAALTGVKLVMLTSSVDRRDQSPAVKSRLLASLTKPARQSLIKEALAQAAGVATRRQHVDDVINIQPRSARTTGRGRILIVEDNPTNQRVSALMAEKLGYSVDIAGNGLEAVEAAQAIKYDAILMDCQMPELDGYEATKRIRVIESERGDSPVPVVAMTASVLAGERERCQEAGMNDYLSKPVTLDVLRATLDEFVTESDESEKEAVAIEATETEVTATDSNGTDSNGADSSGTNRSESVSAGAVSSVDSGSDSIEDMPEFGHALAGVRNDAGPTADDTRVIDLARFEAIRSLQDDDQEMFQALLDDFVRNMNQRLDDLETSFASNDLEEAARVTHSIAGSSGTFAAVEVERIAREIESDLRANDVTSASSKCPELRAIFAYTLSVFRQVSERR